MLPKILCTNVSVIDKTKPKSVFQFIEIFSFVFRRIKSNRIVMTLAWVNNDDLPKNTKIQDNWLHLSGFNVYFIISVALENQTYDLCVASAMIYPLYYGFSFFFFCSIWNCNVFIFGKYIHLNVCCSDKLQWQLL